MSWVVATITIVSAAATVSAWRASQPSVQAGAAISRGKQLEERGNLNEAERAFIEAVALAPDDAETYRQLGFFQIRIRDWEGGSIALCQSLAIDPDDINALVNVGLAFAAMGDFEEAVVHHSLAAERAPDSDFVWRNYSGTLLGVDNIQAGIEAAERSIAIEPHEVGWNNLSLGRLEAGQSKKAADAARSGLQINPTDSTMQYVHVVATGRLEGWDRARTLATTYEWDDLRYGLVLVGEGEYERGHTFANTALVGADRAMVLAYSAAARDMRTEFERRSRGHGFSYDEAKSWMDGNGFAIGGYSTYDGRKYEPESCDEISMRSERFRPRPKQP